MSLKSERTHPDWSGWSWARNVLLISVLIFSLSLVLNTLLEDRFDKGEVGWSVVLLIAYLLCVWKKPEAFSPLVFSGSFLVVSMSVGEIYQGACWFLAFAVCVDANVRLTSWVGVSVTAMLIAAELYLGDLSRGSAASILFLFLLMLFGQAIRLIVAGSRTAITRAELSRELEREELIQAVHDSGAARLTQLLMMARGMQRREACPQDFRDALGAMIDVAEAGARELRMLINPERRALGSSDMLSHEWSRSIGVLQAAGFEVVDSFPIGLSIARPELEQMLTRIVREVTANICTHAKKGGRVAALYSVDEKDLTLSWLNDVSPRNSPSTSGMGLSGVSKSVRSIGGSLSHGVKDSVFSLRVSIPVSGATGAIP